MEDKLMETPTREVSVTSVEQADSGLSRRFIMGGAVAALGLGFVRAEAMAAVPEGAVTQTATFSLDPARAEDAEAALRKLVAAVEAAEPGVLAYICHRQTADPTKVTFFEVYQDEETLKAHGQQPHLGELRAAFGSGLFKAPFEIVRLSRIAGFCR